MHRGITLRAPRFKEKERKRAVLERCRMRERARVREKNCDGMEIRERRNELSDERERKRKKEGRKFSRNGNLFN